MSLSLSELLKREIARKSVRSEETGQNGPGRVEIEGKEASVEERVGEEQLPVESGSTTIIDESNGAERLRKVQETIAAEKAAPLPPISIEDITASGDKALLARKCNQCIHRIVDDWGEHSQDYSPPGTSATLLLDTKRSLFPLLVQLRKDTLPRELLTSLASLLYHLQQRTRADQDAALQLYLKLSIGDAAWPIGVSDVGIHARSNHTRIAQGGNSDIANIMRDEQTRLWIVAVKRLVSYEQWALRSVCASR